MSTTASALMNFRSSDDRVVRARELEMPPRDLVPGSAEHASFAARRAELVGILPPDVGTMYGDGVRNHPRGLGLA